MSHAPQAPKKPSIPDLRAAKGERKLVLLTAYTAPMASILSDHCDMLMVGDSLGMVVYGFDSTLPVTLDMMINHGAAVVRGANGTPVVVDLPFGSYQGSKEQAFESASRVMKETGASSVKMEGGAEMTDLIEKTIADRARAEKEAEIAAERAIDDAINGGIQKDIQPIRPIRLKPRKPGL